MKSNDKILILDFGSQYTQLIARRVREIGVFSEVKPSSISTEEIIKMNPSGIILSGGPETVTISSSQKVHKSLLEAKIPILGICYGMQTIANELGGKVVKSDIREFGHAEISHVNQSILFDNVSFDSDSLDVWMSHGDKVEVIPENFEIIASSKDCKVAGFQNSDSNIFGLQFHPEVTHTNQGEQILSNFIFKVCSCSKNWSTSDIINSMVSDVKNKVKNEKVLLGLSGGVDSSVVAMLLQKAIGNNLICIFVDHGLLRLGEVHEVMSTFEALDIDIRLVDASELFFSKLSGVTDPEQKRKIIGNTFIDVFENEAKKIKDVDWLAQGTIYPDVIESISVKGPSATIKSHHNVGGLPEKMNLKVIEPLKMLFKDEVRKIGTSLKMPQEILSRHPFPGPGLGIRILGEVDHESIGLIQEADKIYIDALKKWNLYNKIWQAGSILLPVKSVGVMGDERTYERCVALRAVVSTDGMTADWYEFPNDFLKEVSNNIINKVKGINRVVYDISSKPPATIEWE